MFGKQKSGENSESYNHSARALFFKSTRLLNRDDFAHNYFNLSLELAGIVIIQYCKYYNLFWVSFAASQRYSIFLSLHDVFYGDNIRNFLLMKPAVPPEPSELFKYLSTFNTHIRFKQVLKGRKMYKTTTDSKF